MYGIVNQEKINVYVPEKTGASLKNDAEQFEIFKKNGRDINLNRFLSRLLSGYYQCYKQERHETETAVKSVVERFVKEDGDSKRLVEEIMDRIVLPEIPSRKGRNPVRLALKPTYETDQCITEIIQSLGPNDYISQYLCRLFISYCEKPIYEREKLVFQDETEFLLKACKTRREISFGLTNTPQTIHHVIPYELTSGSDERFNYLMGQEYNVFKKRNEAKSFRLCRIVRPSYRVTSGTLEDRTIHFLEEMKKLGPQYAINEDSETCVQLTQEGRRSFRMIYQGRPLVDRIEENPDDGTALYYFKSSQTQLFLYFRRFNAREAVVLYPESLKERLYHFFTESQEIYRP